MTGLLIIFIISIFGYAAALAVALLWNVIQSAYRFRPAKKFQAEMNETISPSVVVTLIHGTWAARAEWIQKDSHLCHVVRQALPTQNIQFVPFMWSGRNSISARHKAGKDLAANLRKLHEKWPLAPHILIAHSHGGSVALLALHDESVREAVVGVACLSTPFLLAGTRPVSRIAGAGLSLAPAIFILVGSVAVLQHIPLTALSDLKAQFEASIAFFVLLIASLVAFHAPQLIRSQAKVILAKMQLPELATDRLLIIRTPSDEASAALGAVQILNFVVSRVWDGTSQVVDDAIRRADQWTISLRRLGMGSFMIIAFLILTPFAMVLSGYVLHATKGFGLLDMLSMAALCIGIILMSLLMTDFPKVVGLLLLGVVAAPLPVFLAVLALPFGAELALVSLVLNVSAEPTPLGTWQVRQFNPVLTNDRRSGSGLGLMHSLSYNDPTALSHLATWMQQRVPFHASRH